MRSSQARLGLRPSGLVRSSRRRRMCKRLQNLLPSTPRRRCGSFLRKGLLAKDPVCTSREEEGLLQGSRHDNMQREMFRFVTDNFSVSIKPQPCKPQLPASGLVTANDEIIYTMAARFGIDSGRERVHNPPHPTKAKATALRFLPENGMIPLPFASNHTTH